MDQRDNLTGAAPHSNSPPAGQPATEPPSSSATTNPAAAAGTFSDGDSLAGQIAEDPAEGVFVSNPLAAGGPTPTPQLLASLARAGSTTSLGSTLRRPGAGGDDSAEASVRRAFSLNRLRAGGEMAGSPEVGAPGPPSEPKAEDPAAATAAVADHETDQLLHGLAGAGKVPPPPGAAPAPGRPFTTVDLLQASIRETRLHELALERGRLISQRSRLAGWLFKTWTVSQEGVALFIAGIIIAFVVCFLELSRDWLSSLRRGYCARATQFWLDQEACCAVAAALAQGTSVSPGGGGQLLAPVSPVSEGIVVVLDTPCPDFVTWAEIIGSNQSGLLLLVQLAFAALYAGIAAMVVLRVWPLAAGSGLPPVKAVLAGGSCRRLLGRWTIVVKTVAAAFASASSLLLGVEGPIIQASAAVAYSVSRAFPRLGASALPRRDMAMAGACAGVACSFQAPLGAALYVIEDCGYFVSPVVMLKCLWTVAVCLFFYSFLDPYRLGALGSRFAVFNKPLIPVTWNYIDLPGLLLVGLLTGALGAIIIRLIMTLNRLRRRSPLRQAFARWAWPGILEASLVAMITVASQFYFPLAWPGQAVLLRTLFGECSTNPDSLPLGLCNFQDVGGLIGRLIGAFFLKFALLAVSAGLRVPAGIFIPSLALGALFGRMVGTLLGYWAINDPTSLAFHRCAVSGIASFPASCVSLSMYAIAGAAGFMASTSRITFASVAIVVEASGQTQYILPVCLVVAVSYWVSRVIHPAGIFEELLIFDGHPYLERKQNYSRRDNVLDLVALRPVYKARSAPGPAPELAYLLAGWSRSSFHPGSGHTEEDSIGRPRRVGAKLAARQPAAPGDPAGDPAGDLPPLEAPLLALPCLIRAGALRRALELRSVVHPHRPGDRASDRPPRAYPIVDSLATMRPVGLASRLDLLHALSGRALPGDGVGCRAPRATRRPPWARLDLGLFAEGGLWRAFIPAEQDTVESRRVRAEARAGAAPDSDLDADSMAVELEADELDELEEQADRRASRSAATMSEADDAGSCSSGQPGSIPMVPLGGGTGTPSEGDSHAEGGSIPDSAVIYLGPGPPPRGALSFGQFVDFVPVTVSEIFPVRSLITMFQQLGIRAALVSRAALSPEGLLLPGLPSEAPPPELEGGSPGRPPSAEGSPPAGPAATAPSTQSPRSPPSSAGDSVKSSGPMDAADLFARSPGNWPGDGGGPVGAVGHPAVGSLVAMITRRDVLRHTLGRDRRMLDTLD